MPRVDFDFESVSIAAFSSFAATQDEKMMLSDSPTKIGRVPSSRFDYELLLMSRFFFGHCQIDGRHDPDDNIVRRLHLSEKFQKTDKTKI